MSLKKTKPHRRETARRLESYEDLANSNVQFTPPGPTRRDKTVGSSRVGRCD